MLGDKYPLVNAITRNYIGINVKVSCYMAYNGHTDMHKMSSIYCIAILAKITLFLSRYPWSNE